MTQTTVAILDEKSAYLVPCMQPACIRTLLAVVCEDPTSWQDLLVFWPRHRTSDVPASLDEIVADRLSRSSERFSRSDVGRSLEPDSSWLVVDVHQKRILDGRRIDFAASIQPDEEECRRAMAVERMPFAPWWEVHVEDDLAILELPRARPLTLPRVDRDVLYGPPLLEDLARRMLAVVRTPAWRSTGADRDAHARYRFTVAVHRDWLMTPREDLQGRMPRQLLHEGRDWMDALIELQSRRLRKGDQLVAVPKNVTGYTTAPMATEEVVVYFDLCRELIEQGWEWCARHTRVNERRSRKQQRRALVKHLEAIESTWSTNSYDGGAPPAEILEYTRRRVPRASGVTIDGIERDTSSAHLIDCDCPICQLMADGAFGLCVEMLDGHHLDLDDDFAFSLSATQEAWEKERVEFGIWSEEVEDDEEVEVEEEQEAGVVVEEQSSAETETNALDRKAAEHVEHDELAPVWSGLFHDEPFPGDPRGYIRLAFLLAEIVSLLESSGASRSEIRKLNEAFRDFRRCEVVDLPLIAKRFSELLEQLAQHHPSLTSRAADFQSRIDEHLRSSTASS